MGDERMTVRLDVNGKPVSLATPPHRTLLDALRYDLDLTGTKECCAEGECGACTVLVNGEAINACLVLAVEMEGAEITTIEGLAGDGGITRLQDAFVANGAVQCGFCIPGMVMAAHYLLGRTPAPTDAEVREGLSGNLCRCGGYNQICHAVAAAAADRSGPGTPGGD